MSRAHVVILHPTPAPDAGPLTRFVADARAALAHRHRDGFRRAGATTARIGAGPPDDRSFGERLREVVQALLGADMARADGIVVLGSGAVPLITAAERRRFVAVAASGDRVALVNNRFSADILAIPRAAEVLESITDLATDNALPRWLASTGHLDVGDLRGRWRLGVDIDGPLDVLLTIGRRGPSTTLDEVDPGPVERRIAAIRGVTSDPDRELVVAGRTSARSLAWLERHTASRTRAFVEERGLRTAAPDQRPARSLLGELLARDGTASLGEHLGRLGDAAIVDTRVLLAHRHGADGSAWPVAEDRFASDLLLHERIADPWLRDLTRSAAEAPIPILLGGHTVVGPGVRLVVQAGTRRSTWT